MKIISFQYELVLKTTDCGTDKHIDESDLLQHDQIKGREIMNIILIIVIFSLSGWRIKMAA